VPKVLPSQSSHRRNSRPYCILLILWLITAVALGQSITNQESNLPHKSTSETETHTEESRDPLGRSTPHGSVFGFLHAAQVVSTKKPLNTSSSRTANEPYTVNSLPNNSTSS